MIRESGEQNQTKNQERLEQIFGRAGIPLGGDETRAFLLFYELLTEANQKINLTAITEPEDVFIKHFLDSAILWKLLKENGYDEPFSSVIDIGTGAGFPGVPLKILRSDISLCLLDALDKRIGFLREAVRTLELSEVTLLHSRSEDAAKAGKSAIRETFDLAVSRAVSRLPVLLEYGLPFVKVGGLFAAYKSGEVEEEIETAGRALGILGGSIEKVIFYTLPDTDYSRSLILIRKTGATPPEYPRRAGKPEKTPLLA